jgi:hypothetical protein
MVCRMLVSAACASCVSAFFVRIRSPSQQMYLLFLAASFFACQGRTGFGLQDASRVSGNDADAATSDATVVGPGSCSGAGCRPVACDKEFWLGGLPAAMTGESPVAIVAVDFDGDGNLDVATANDTASSVSLLFGRGNGTFRAKVDYPTGSTPIGLVTADWNRDGKPDLATASGTDGTVSVFLNQGNGVLARQSALTVGASPRALLTADLDSDGFLDLAVANGDAASVSVLFGKGDGTFASRVDYATGSSPDAIVAGDFNRDGRMDLVVGKDSDPPSLTVLLGEYPRSFALRPALAIDKLDCVSSLAAVDFNGDDKLDLAVVRGQCQKGNGSIFMLAGSGDGSFSFAREYSELNGVPETVDVNGDGRLDLAVLNGDVLYVLFGQKSGPLSAPVRYGPSVLWGETMAIGDFNRDGKVDIASADWSTKSVLVVLGNGDGTVATPDPYAGGPYLGPVLTRDLDGDGRLDAVAVGPEGAVRVLLGKGDGTLAQSADYDVGGKASGIAIGDLDGDGKLDMVTTSESNTVSILLGQDAGKFAPRKELPVGRESACPTLGDVNADGKLDLVLRHAGDGLVGVWLGQGDGTFTFSSDIAMAHALGYVPASCLALGDFDGDHILDVVVIDQMGGVAQGKGDGTFGPVTQYLMGEQPDAILLGDWNGDSAIDILVTHRIGVCVLLGGGDGTFSAASGPPVGSWWNGSFGGFGVSLADLNGDGHVDLVAGFPNLIDVFLGDGTGTFACEKLYARGGSLAIGDMNGDGRQDAVVVDSFSDALTVLTNSPL